MGNSNQPLWICGPPGCGKTVIASTIIKDLLSSANASAKVGTGAECFVGYAFGSRRTEIKRKPSTLLKSILHQVIHCPTLTEDQKLKIYEDWRKHGSSLSTVVVNPSQDPILSLVSLLAHWLGNFESVFLILDGLDECESIERLLKAVLDIEVHLKTKLSWLFLSQQQQSIFSLLDTKSLKINMDSQEMRSMTSGDIKKYVAHEFAKAVQDSRLTGNESVFSCLIEVANGIAKQADGFFLWATLATQDLITRSLFEARAGPSEILKSINRLPASLNNMFRAYLDRVVQGRPDVDPAENNKRKDALLVLLRWIFHATRPLTIAELGDALTVEDENLGESSLPMAAQSGISSDILHVMIKLCYPILLLQNDTVSLLHTTFKDLIQENKFSGASEIIGYTDEEDNAAAAIVASLGGQSTQNQIVDRILSYLEQADFDFDDALLLQAAKIREAHPFLEYAVSFLEHHIKACKVVPNRLQERIVHFVESDNAITWLEQWADFPHGIYIDLQRRLFQHVEALKNRHWVLDALAKGAQARRQYDPSGKDPQTRKLAKDLASMYVDCGRLHEAEHEYSFVYEKLLENDLGSEELISAKNNMAFTYAKLQKHEKALELYQDVKRQWTQLRGPSSEECVVVNNNIAASKSWQGKYDEAEELHRANYEVRKKRFGIRDYRTFVSANNLAVNLNAQSKIDDLETIFNEYTGVRDLFRKSNPKNALHLDEWEVLIMNARGKWIAASSEAKSLYSGWTDLAGAIHPNTLIAMNNYACNLEKIGSLGEASEIFEKLVSIYVSQRQENSSHTLIAKNNLASNFARQEKFMRAAALHLENYNVREKILGPKHNDTLLSLQNVGDALLSSAQLADAEHYILKAFDLASSLFSFHQMKNHLRILAPFCLQKNFLSLAEFVRKLIIQLSTTPGGKQCYESFGKEELRSAGSRLRSNTCLDAPRQMGPGRKNAAETTQRVPKDCRGCAGGYTAALNLIYLFFCESRHVTMKQSIE